MSCSQYHMIWSDEIAARCFWLQPVEVWLAKLTHCSCLEVHQQCLASWCLRQAAINSWDTRKYSFQNDEGDATYIFHSMALNASNYDMEISYDYEWNLFYVAICIISNIVLMTGSVDLKSNNLIWMCCPV